jgi:DNA repair protein RAD50
VNDPQITDEAEVLAQIKLRFKAVNGLEMVVTRSLSATVKKGSISQRALEGVLVTKNEFNQTKSVSSKCSELDSEIPSLLGVSKVRVLFLFLGDP